MVLSKAVVGWGAGFVILHCLIQLDCVFQALFGLRCEMILSVNIKSRALSAIAYILNDLITNKLNTSNVYAILAR